jgi:hypothetical protein
MVFGTAERTIDPGRGMNKQKWIILVAVLVLLGGAGVFLSRLQNFQKLGSPGVKTRMVDTEQKIEVALPERVLDYTSDRIPTDKITTEMLPKDTCLGQRLYQAPDGFGIQMNVVLMGGDRTSIHRAEACLRGSGWVINKTDAAEVPIARPIAYTLPVTKLSLIPEPGSPKQDHRAIYLYWFVTDDDYTRSQSQWMQRLLWNLVTKGVLQRWAYISCMAECPVGQEDATFERMKSMIAAAAPEFQIVPKPAENAITARQ